MDLVYNNLYWASSSQGFYYTLGGLQPNRARLMHLWAVGGWGLETWGAGVDIHTIDTLSSLFQFRTHFLVRFVPNKLPLPLAQLMVLNDM